MKVLAMIPARLGSKRVPKKNIRLLNGVPLISYAITAAKESGCFDDIYVNSESDLLGQVASESGVKFYKRSADLSLDSATNDDFAHDFLKKKECDVLVQILPTSPFVSAKEIKQFVEKLKVDKLDTLISVSNQQIECVYKGNPINFDQKKITPPSQEVDPVQPYACSLMAWGKQSYMKNMEKYNAAYHGGDGKKGFFVLKGFSVIDIDNEEDFQLAEVVSKYLNNKSSIKARYYCKEHSEVDVPSILFKDGVNINNLHDANKGIVSVNRIREENDDLTSWSHRVINTESNSATLIHQQPGEGNRRHYHPDWNEWWYIIDGQWEWEISGVIKTVKKDDLVFIPKGVVHKIKAIGNKPAIRLAVSREDVAHIYPNEKTIMQEDIAHIYSNEEALNEG